MGHSVCLQTHLIGVVSWRSDFLQVVAVHDPFYKIQVGSHECNLPLPTIGHTAAANKNNYKIKKFTYI